MVMAWSVDRLGRSLQDLVAFLGELHAKRVDLYLHQQGLDTTTPAGARAAEVRRMRANGAGIGKIARTLGVGVGYVQRIVTETHVPAPR
jgi:DNA invertase Pin-like site-specific DNA recombinase